jgi:hypothetical protein
LYQTLLPGLVDRYRARVGQRRYVTAQALFTSVVREDHEEEFIEIRQRNDSRLITLVDVASPANRTTAAGRQAYLDKRREAKAVNANLVEIDLVMQGLPLLDFSREGLQEWDQAVIVTRATQADRYEIYTATLQKQLPRFRLPLAADDRDTERRAVELARTGQVGCGDECHQISDHAADATARSRCTEGGSRELATPITRQMCAVAHSRGMNLLRLPLL